LNFALDGADKASCSNFFVLANPPHHPSLSRRLGGSTNRFARSDENKIYAFVRNRTPTDFSAHNLVIRPTLTEIRRLVCAEVDTGIEKFILIWFYPRMQSEAEGTHKQKAMVKRRKCRRKRG